MGKYILVQLRISVSVFHNQEQLTMVLKNKLFFIKLCFWFEKQSLEDVCSDLAKITYLFFVQLYRLCGLCKVVFTTISAGKIPTLLKK